MKIMHVNTDTFKRPYICSECKADLHAKMINSPGSSDCPSCGAQIHIIAFPALAKDVSAGKPGDPLLLGDESGCFYHPGKKAVIPCSACGRYLCALCDVEINNQHICPPCIEAGKSGQISDNMVTQLVRYDKIAFFFSVVPILIPFITFITATIAVYIVVRYWKTPVSLVSGGKIRFVASFIISALQLVIWGLIIYRWIN
ncbi:MAG: hypothetical protein GY795_17750 [Desulfobacterales bacterium]|nr:hypothetical protein [Desulfobacterales bacterium]